MIRHLSLSRAELLPLNLVCLGSGGSWSGVSVQKQRYKSHQSHKAFGETISQPVRSKDRWPMAALRRRDGGTWSSTKTGSYLMTQ